MRTLLLALSFSLAVCRSAAESDERVVVQLIAFVLVLVAGLIWLAARSAKSGPREPDGMAEQIRYAPRAAVRIATSAVAVAQLQTFQQAIDEAAAKCDGNWFYARVAGVSFKNDDGSSRQAVIRLLQPREQLRLEPEPGNVHDKHAIAVLTAYGEQIGYLESRVAEEVSRDVRLRKATYAAFVDGTGKAGRGKWGVRMGLLRWYPSVGSEVK